MSAATDAMRAPYVLNRHDGEFVSTFGTLMAVRAPSQATDGAFSFFESWGPKGGGSPPHVHRKEDEAWYVVSGRAEIHVGSETFEVGPGTWAFLPRGVPHCILMLEELDQLIVAAPGGAEGFLRAIGVPAASDEPVEVRAPSPDDFPRMLAASEEHDVEMLGADAWEREWPGQEAMVVVRPEDGGWRDVQGGRARVLLDGERTAGAYTVLEVELGGGPVALRTPGAVEGWHVLEGRVTVQADGHEVVAEPSGFALLRAEDVLVADGPLRALVAAVGVTDADGFAGWA